jgi:hypothetical protein
MTARRCYRRILREFKLANIIICLCFAIFIGSLNLLDRQMRLLKIPLLIFPGVHVVLLAMICIVVVRKPLKSKLSIPLLAFWLIVLYANMTIWGFKSDAFKLYRAQQVLAATQTSQSSQANQTVVTWKVLKVSYVLMFVTSVVGGLVLMLMSTVYVFWRIGKC